MNLADFLLREIAADEEVARAASGDRWDRLADGDPKFRKVVAWGLTPIGAMNAEHDADHIARWGPARVLAECESKRRIVEVHDGVHECPGGPNLVSVPDFQDGSYGGPCQTLRFLAQPYRDREGYRQEWDVQ